MTESSDRVRALAAQGVDVMHPESVYIDADVMLDRVAPGAALYPGCRIHGSATSIGPGCRIGEEGPVTLHNCQLADGVRLKGGAFDSATFLAEADVGPSAHVRPGTLLEEQASCAHAVGLKQTILMPFTVLGSLINFCDCLMSGGTSRRDHSEVGSSFVHFNFTPHQDKATASLFGDVPRGVMLDQPPIFLGGQGGIVGPVAVTFGTVIAAGTVFRRDIATPGRLFYGNFQRSAGSVPYTRGHYGDIHRILKLNVGYVAQLHALRAWYEHVRAPFLNTTPWGAACYAGALTRLDEAVAERVARLNQLAVKMEASLALAAARHGAALPEQPYDLQKRLLHAAPALTDALRTASPAPPPPTQLMTALTGATDYLAAIAALPPAARRVGTEWLDGVVLGVKNRANDALWK